MRISDWSSDVCSSDLCAVRSQGWFHRRHPTPRLLPQIHQCPAAHRFEFLWIYGFAPFADPALLVCQRPQYLLTSLDRPLRRKARRPENCFPSSFGQGDTSVARSFIDPAPQPFTHRPGRTALLATALALLAGCAGEIGRASCRERVCQYV